MKEIYKCQNCGEKFEVDSEFYKHHMTEVKSALEKVGNNTFKGGDELCTPNFDIEYLSEDSKKAPHRCSDTEIGFGVLIGLSF